MSGAGDTGMRRRAACDPDWASLPRPRFGFAQTVAILVRHAIPLAGLVWFGGSPARFVLLSVFGIALGIACIGVVGVAVSTRQQAGAGRGIAGGIGDWLTLLAVGAGISVMLTALFGWIALALARERGEAVLDVSLGWSALAIVISAAPGVLQRYRADLLSTLDEEQRKRRDQPEVVALLFCGALAFMMCALARHLGRYAFGALSVAITLLFVFRDLRPDLVREWTRPGNAPPRA